MDEEVVLVSVDMFSDENFDNTLEFHHAHPKQIDRLYDGLDHRWLKSEKSLTRIEHLIDHLKDDVFHRRKIEGFDDEFGTVLYTHPQVYFLFVVGLNSQHQVEVDEVGSTSV